MAYLTAAEFRDETVAPAHHIDEIALISPLWLDRQLAKQSGWIDSRLRKRYAAPFVAPYPEAVKDWLTKLVTHNCYLRRGFDPNDPQAADIVEDAKTAKAEVEEAANAETGLFDLPLRADTTASGIVNPGPRVASQQSPYAWMKTQRDKGRNEDGQ